MYVHYSTNLTEPTASHYYKTYKSCPWMYNCACLNMSAYGQALRFNIYTYIKALRFNIYTYITHSYLQKNASHEVKK